MAGLNKVILIGNLGRDPEVRWTGNGLTVANFTLATTEKWNTREGNREEKTEWHRIVAFGKLAEICKDYLSKGKQIYVEGRLQTRQWEDREGQKRSTTEIVASNILMLGSPGGGGGGGGGPSSGGSGGGYGGDDDYGPPSDGPVEDDLPF